MGSADGPRPTSRPASTGFARSPVGGWKRASKRARSANKNLRLSATSNPVVDALLHAIGDELLYLVDHQTGAG